MVGKRTSKKNREEQEQKAPEDVADWSWKQRAEESETENGTKMESAHNEKCKLASNERKTFDRKKALRENSCGEKKLHHENI